MEWIIIQMNSNFYFAPSFLVTDETFDRETGISVPVGFSFIFIF